MLFSTHVQLSTLLNALNNNMYGVLLDSHHFNQQYLTKKKKTTIITMLHNLHMISKDLTSRLKQQLFVRIKTGKM